MLKALVITSKSRTKEYGNLIAIAAAEARKTHTQTILNKSCQKPAWKNIKLKAQSVSKNLVSKKYASEKEVTKRSIQDFDDKSKTRAIKEATEP